MIRIQAEKAELLRRQHYGPRILMLPNAWDVASARILEEGYALRAGDIDIIYLNGYGFPAYRGGPMWYADTVGLKKVYERVSDFQRAHGELWEPAPLLKQLAAEGKTFADFDRQKVAAT